MSTATTSLMAASGEVINTQDQFEVCYLGFPTFKKVLINAFAIIGVQ